MAKKSEQPIKLYVGKTLNYKVEYGKYKDKLLIWVAKNDLEFFQQIETLYYSKYNLPKQKYFDKLKKRFIQNNGLVSRDGLHDIIHEIIDLMRQKYSSEKLHQHLVDKYQYSSKIVGQIISDANSLIRKEFELEKNFLLDIHLIRYEEIFEDCMNPNIDNVPAGFRRAVLCEHYLNAMETLFQKEKLLGIHTKKFKLKANSIIPQQRLNTDFDLTKLTSTEQLEVFQLLNKAKPVEQLIRTISANTNPLEIDSSIKVEEVVVDTPIRKAKQTDQIGDKEKEQLKSTGKDLFEVKQAIHKTLEDKVKEMFEKKK